MRMHTPLALSLFLRALQKICCYVVGPKNLKLLSWTPIWAEMITIKYNNVVIPHDLLQTECPQITEIICF